MNDLNLRRGDQLPPYNPESTCPKCLSENVRSYYRNDGCSDPECWKCPPEHILRTCDRCRYQWAEAVYA